MKKSQSEDQAVEVIEISSIMDNVLVRKFINRIITTGGVDSSVFDTDPYKHAYNSGWRDFGLRIKNEIENAAPDKYALMKREAIND